MLVDDVGVRVLQPFRHRPGTPQMRVAGREILVHMLDDLGVVRRSEQKGERQADSDEAREDGEGGYQAHPRPEPAGESRPVGVCTADEPMPRTNQFGSNAV